jgi:hypothetical protein
MHTHNQRSKKGNRKVAIYLNIRFVMLIKIVYILLKLEFKIDTIS